MMKMSLGISLLLISASVISAQSDEFAYFGNRGGWSRGSSHCGQGQYAGSTTRGGMMNRGSWGHGMMGNRGYSTFNNAERIELADAVELAEQFMETNEYDDLEIIEVMEFEQNFYVQVFESDTGIGAMELLIDPYTGYIGDEPGPNMMWNTKYGHMNRRWRSNRSMSLDSQEAIVAANAALAADFSDLVAETHADEFYGYYTIHVLNQQKDIVGMLSVNGFDGSVWYHDWHGDFIGMMDSH